MSVLALSPPAIGNMSRPSPTPATEPLHVQRHHDKSTSNHRLTPSLLTVPRISRKRATAKVPVTISHSCVSLGWWMVMSDDEQGYAPAAYLEPVEGAGKLHSMEEQEMEKDNSSFEGEQANNIMSFFFFTLGFCIHIFL